MRAVDLSGARVRGARFNGSRMRLRIVLNEEWEHRLYAERDLTALEKGN
jgi:hypothetical protein